MIFAAGLGTRLRPLTDNMPKAMVPVAGKPMLQRVIENLKQYGFNDIIINVHHFGEQIIDFVKENNNFGINIAISDERGELLDTGGGILKAEAFLDGDEPFLVHNADILTNLDLNDLYNFHINHKADATVLVAPRKTQRYLVFDSQDRLCGWTNLATGECRPADFDATAEGLSKLAFGGVHVISTSIFKALREYTTEHKFSITPFYVDTCRKLKIMGYQPASHYDWFDIGKPETLALAEKFIKESAR